MKKKLFLLLCSIIFNAFGTALMSISSLGMTAWGFASSNFGNYYNMSLGISFLILSLFFYILAYIINKGIPVKETIFSILFLVSYAYVVDFFMFILTFLHTDILVYRIMINIVGLLSIMFGIGIHLKIHIALHPMDVYLDVVQKKLKSVIKGTYLAYSSAFITGGLFGILKGDIINLGLGTILTLTLSGILIEFYNRILLDNIERGL